MTQYARAAKDELVSILIPATVIAEVWRTPAVVRSQWTISLADAVVAIDEARAKGIGELIGIARSTQIVDGSVAAIAVEFAPSIVVTSDPGDIEYLVRSAGASVSVGRRTTSKAAVVIEKV